MISNATSMPHESRLRLRSKIDRNSIIIANNVIPNQQLAYHATCAIENGAIFCFLTSGVPSTKCACAM
jgi:hypothetical protein